MALWRRFLERTHFCTKNLTRNFLTQKSLYSQIYCTKVGTSYKNGVFRRRIPGEPFFRHNFSDRCGRAQLTNIAVSPDADPPRIMFVADSSILWEWPRTIPRNPVTKIKPPRQVRGVEWPGMWCALKSLNLPILGPINTEPTIAARPPTAWTLIYNRYITIIRARRFFPRSCFLVNSDGKVIQ